MEPIPLRKPQLLLMEGGGWDECRDPGEDCAGALAATPEGCAAMAEAVRERVPTGYLVDGLPGPRPGDSGESSPTQTLIARYKEQLRPGLPEHADFLYLRGTDSFASLRCAVLAATDLTGRSLMAEVTVASDGLLPFGTEVVAAVGVLQRIGVSSVVLAGESPAAIHDALAAAAPYARVSLGARIDPAWLCGTYGFPNLELAVPRRAADTGALRAALAQWDGPMVLPRDHDEYLLAPDGTHPHFIDPTIDISDEIPVDGHLSERLLEAEDETGAVKLVLADETDLSFLEEQVFMLSRPVCLCAGQPELLEKALRIYPGRALYDGTWPQEERLVKYFSEKYGMIVL